MQMSCPTSFLHSRHPLALAPEGDFLARWYHEPEGSADAACPVTGPFVSADPPDVSVKYSRVQAAGCTAVGMAASPVVVLSSTHQK
jgi:hypothetical protein